MTNPLLGKNKLLPFGKIKPQHLLPAINKVIAENNQELQKILQHRHFTWENLIRPLEDMENKLHITWATVHHLHATVNSPAIRAAYNKALQKVTHYSTSLLHNHALYRAVESIVLEKEYENLDITQRRIVGHKLRDFRLAGVDLPHKDKHRFAQMQKKLSKLLHKFSNNVLDATKGWTYLANETEISGIPEHALATAHEHATLKKQKGWLFTLNAPSYLAVMTYADSRLLREKFYTAYITRASECGPNAKKWDNGPAMTQILQLRHKMSALLGFDNFAELSLETKTAPHTDDVVKFLYEMAQKSHHAAKKELKELRHFAHKDCHIAKLEPWDLAYCSEKLYQRKFKISQEELRAYFPVDHVLSGIFSVIHKLYAVSIAEQHNADVWHKNVRLFKFCDKKGNLLGNLYLDLYTRSNKQNGAWMHDCQMRHRLLDNSMQTPIAYIICNFQPPVKNKPTLLTHDEIHILFHEFGHALHHLLTKIEHMSISGVGNVPWDTVEFPSHFMENWAWEKPVLKMISKHHKTGKHLDDHSISKLRAAKHFHAGLAMLRQMEFSLFDFLIHLEEKNAHPEFIQNTLDKIRKQIAVVPIAKFNRFPNTFLHIFADAYAAGYYGYKWAEVMAADAFEKFLEHGIFDRAVAKSFLTNILEKGGSDDPIALFEKFRGRKPTVNALLKLSGIKSN